MSELAFTLARLGFLALLWFFVLLVVRALRQDVAGAAPANRQRQAGPAQPAPTG